LAQPVLYKRDTLTVVRLPFLLAVKDYHRITWHSCWCFV